MQQLKSLTKLQHKQEIKAFTGVQFPGLLSPMVADLKLKGVITMYKADYADDNFEVIYADNDKEAMKEAEKYESEHGIVFNVFEIDEEYNEVRTIY